MRAFSILATTLALALSANAAVIEKRDVTAPVQTCINDLNAAGQQLLVVTAAVSGFTSSAGYSGALNVHSQEQTLEGLMKTANTDCCVQKTTVSEEDATAVLNIVSSLVPNITASLNVIVAKKAEFAKVLFATTIVKSDISSLKGLLSTLDGCLVAVTPADDLAAANAYVSTINADFAAAYSAYGISS